MIVERLLHRVQLAVRGEALDRGDLGAVGLDAEHGAGLHRLAVEQHRAGAARRRVATDVRAREREPLAQDVDEQVTRLELQLVARSVDGQGDRSARRPPSSAGRCRAYSSRRPAKPNRRIVVVDDRDQGDPHRRARAAGSPWRPRVARTAQERRRLPRLEAPGRGHGVVRRRVRRRGRRRRASPTSAGTRRPERARRGVRPARASRRRRRLGALPAARGLGARARLRHARDDRREDDAESLAWADRRGFREVGRSSRLVLDLTAIDAPAVDPPEGVEIVTWADRPDLTPRMYEVACEAIRTCRATRTRRWTPYETGSRRTCEATATGPRRRSSRSSDGEVAGLREAVALELATRASPTTT